MYSMLSSYKSSKYIAKCSNHHQENGQGVYIGAHCSTCTKYHMVRPEIQESLKSLKSPKSSRAQILVTRVWARIISSGARISARPVTTLAAKQTGLVKSNVLLNKKITRRPKSAQINMVAAYKVCHNSSKTLNSSMTLWEGGNSIDWLLEPMIGQKLWDPFYREVCWTYTCCSI